MKTKTIPKPISPLPGKPVNGLSSVFEWTCDDSLPSCRIQISEDPEFSALLFDAPVGPRREVTLQGILPPTGKQLFWRIGTEAGDSWSDAAPFTAVSDEAYAAFLQEEAKRLMLEQAEMEAALAVAVEIEPEWKVGYTSATEAATITSIMIAGFGAMVALTVLLHS